MITRKEKARLTKAMRINEGLQKDMGVYSVHPSALRGYVHMSEEAFKERFIHYKTERVDENTLELSVRMNGFIVMALEENKEVE